MGTRGMAVLGAALLSLPLAGAHAVAPAPPAEPAEPAERYLPWFGATSVPTSLAPSTQPLPGGGTHTYWSWGVDLLGAPALWDAGFTGKGVKVAVVDGGVKHDHPYLAPNIAWGHNMCPSSDWRVDADGHGTHVAGIVKQMAPDVTLYIVKSISGTAADCRTSTEDAMKRAAAGPDGEDGTADDADIVTVSIGQVAPIGTAYTSLLADPLRAAHDRGTVFVAAAGNSGPVSPGVDAPAAYRSVISVAGFGSLVGDRHVMAEYSSSGITDNSADNRYHGEVDVTAPASNIVSTFTDTEIAKSSGTSMAAPHVAGLMALLEQARPRLSSTDARARVRCASKDLAAAGNLTTGGYDVSSGHGLLDGRRIVDGPCYSPIPPLTTIDAAFDDERDYDGDGFVDTLDPYNAASESRAQAGAADYVEFGGVPGDNAMGGNDAAVLVAPDGRMMAIATTEALPWVRVWFDGRVEGGDEVTVSDSLVGALADGTWTINRPEFMTRTVVSIAGKRLLVDGCCDGPIPNTLTWNWHGSGPHTLFTDDYSGGPGQSPRYLRVYVE